MKVLIATALKKELKLLRRHLDRLGDRDPGTAGDERRTTGWLATGLGTDRTAASLEAAFDASRPDLCVFCGTAGQLDPSLDLGAVFVAEAWRLEAGTRFDVQPALLQQATEAGLTTVPLGLTVHIPVVRAAARRRHFDELGASICDMESAAALMVSAACGVGCLPIKVVSDTSETGMLGFYKEFERNLEKLAQAIAQLTQAL